MKKKQKGKNGNNKKQREIKKEKCSSGSQS